MNYDNIVKLLSQGEKIFNIPLRVTFYCRVSTDSEIQLNSLENQYTYYKELIKSNSCWSFVNGYVEEGISGVSVDKRHVFKQMIRDAKLNKFDLIITKEVSRFARDLEDSIHYIRELKKNGVGVFFENQNLNSFDDNSELILNIMFNLAQEESKKLSKRIKFGHKQAIKNGHVLGSNNITGYKKENCRLTIVEKEAKFVKKVFEYYATGQYGLYRLARKLSELGYYNKNGNLYTKDSLKRIIANPKYKGFYRGHTYETVDYRTKKRKKIPINEQTIYKCNNNIIPAIISESLWDKANKILKNRTTLYQNNNCWSGGLKYPLSSKLYCGEHNISFQRTINKNKTRPTWSCSLYKQYRLKACASPIIKETEIYSVINQVINQLLPKKDIIIKDLIKLYKNTIKDNEYNIELINIQKKVNNIENKKTMALGLVLDGVIKKEELINQFNGMKKELISLNKQKKLVLNNLLLLENYYKTDQLTEMIAKEMNSNLTEDFIRNCIDRINVFKINNNRHIISLEIILKIYNETNFKDSKLLKVPNDTTLPVKYKNNEYKWYLRF